MTEWLDLRGLRCPIPVIRLEARMRQMRPGQAIEVIADDPLARIDLPNAAREAGFSCKTIEKTLPDAFLFRVIAPET